MGDETKAIVAEKKPFPKKKDNPLDIAKILIFVVAVYLYFVGWIYASSYFQYFGVSFNSLEIPVYYFLVYSSKALFNLTTLVFVAPLLILTLGAHRYVGEKLLTIGFLVVLFPILSALATHNGLKDAKNMVHVSSDGTIIENIRIVFTDDAKDKLPFDLIKGNKNNKLRLLRQTKNSYIVVFAQEINTVQKIPFKFTYIVPMKYVMAVRIKKVT